MLIVADSSDSLVLFEHGSIRTWGRVSSSELVEGLVLDFNSTFANSRCYAKL